MKRIAEWTLPFILLGLLAGIAGAAGTPESYDAYLDSLYRGTVPLMTPAELSNLMEDEQADMLLLDIRTAAERSVSYIPGSRFIDFESFTMDELDGVPRTQQVVLYCAVGYRSERVGELILEAGFSEVYNLYGGIIEWHNQGLPTVVATGAGRNEVEKSPVVHGYSSRWGIWVSRGEVLYDPRPEGD